MVIRNIIPILLDGSEYLVTSKFGETEGRPFPHRGIDVVLWRGWGALSYVGAAWDGIVEKVSFDESRGNYVIIRHAQQFESHYYHLADDSVCVSAGDSVHAGERIGFMGNTGDSKGAHLHFQLEHLGVPVDPFPYMIGVETFESEHFNGGEDDWWKIPLDWAIENKIIVGDLNGDLMLDEPCTRRQMMAFLYRIYKLITEGSVQ
jgi:hypothetical protein